MQALQVGVPIVEPSGGATSWFQRLFNRVRDNLQVLVDAATAAQSTADSAVAGLGDKADAATTLTAGGGLTGGGDLSANRTFAVGAGTGITVNADDVAIDTTAEAERIRDVIGTALVAGTNVTITVNDPGDTITIDATGGGGGALSDADYGDITVSGSGAVMTIDPGTVTLAKQANVATGTVFYRKTASAGAPEVQTLATLKTDLGLTGTNSGDQTITLTGDVTGSGTGSFAAALATSGVTAATYGDSTHVPQIAVDAKGRITSASNVAISGGGGSAWTLAGSNTISSAVANVDFTGLGSYSELLIIGTGLTTSSSGFRAVRVSTDGGSTFYSTSGDYLDVSTAGVTTANTALSTHATSTTSARDIMVRISPNISGAPKISNNQQGTYSRFAASTSAIDAVRVFTTAGNLTAGTIYVYGR
jgi:hypothetical protein